MASPESLLLAILSYKSGTRISKTMFLDFVDAIRMKQDIAFPVRRDYLFGPTNYGFVGDLSWLEI